MKKRILSFLLAITLVVSLAMPAYAASYTDLTGHWAKTYMESLSDKGLLSGYSDGTMKPDKTLTVCEALAVLSRFYTLSDQQVEMIQSDYKQTVEAMVTPTVSWAYKNIEICMAAGIITPDELKAAGATVSIKKDLLSLLLVRAMQMDKQADALGTTKLTYADASSVGTKYVGAIAELSTLKILNGDTSNNISPQASVTRAVASAMVYRALAYLDSINKKLVIDAYDNVSRGEGVIVEIGDGNIAVCGLDGLTRRFSVSEETEITINSASKALSTSNAGDYAMLTWRQGTLLRVSVTDDGTVTWAQGLVVTGTDTTAISIKNLKTAQTTSYPLNAAATIIRDGSTAALSALASTDLATLKVVGGKVTQVTAVSAVSDIKATVSDVSYGTTVTVKLTDATGAGLELTYDIALLPTVRRGELIVNFNKLKSGTAVTLNFIKCTQSAITIDGTQTTVTGTLSAYTVSMSGTTWALTVNGKTANYVLDDEVKVYSGSTETALGSIYVGDQVSIICYGSTITQIKLVSAAYSATKVIGTVLRVDTASQIITVLTSENKLVYVSPASGASILKASTGAQISLSSIAAGSTMTTYGAYANSSKFTAQSMLIE